MFNMSKKNFSQFRCKVTNTKERLRHSGINWMSVEIEFLFLDSCFDWNSIDNILLRPILNSNETKSKCDIFSFYHSLSTCSFIHDINFSDDTDSSNTFWVNLSCHLKTIGSGHINISWEYAQNDCSRITNVSIGHRSGDLFNVIWLIWTGHWNTRDTWEIDKCKIRTGWRINMECNSLINDVFTLTAYFIC